MKAIGNVMRELDPSERTNMLCIEDSKLCAVYLWNIQLHNDESITFMSHISTVTASF